MKRTFWIVLALAAVATGATALLQSEPSNAEAGMDAPHRATDTTRGDVQVRHEFVTIAPPVPLPATANRSVAPRQPGPRTPRRAGAWSKTGRALLGDGRHRPAPFPRIK